MEPNPNTVKLQADPDLCDEFAFALLSFETLAEAMFSRRSCPEIKGYYYSGPFEDDLDLLIGPDYSVLLADSTLDRSTQIEAYLCGLRTDLKKLAVEDTVDS